jgi:hypothetical protein
VSSVVAPLQVLEEGIQMQATVQPTFSMTRKIRFGHTDPASIVYYPNYFDMFTGIIEDFSDECVDASFKRLHLTDRIAEVQASEHRLLPGRRSRLRRRIVLRAS